MSEQKEYIGQSILDDNRIRRASSPLVHNGVIIALPFNLGDLIKTDLKSLIPESYGIYYLYYDDILVYIGMSSNLKNRLLGHYKKNDMEFNNVIWFSTEYFGKTLAETFKLESSMIKVYKPFYNQALINAPIM